VSETLAGHAVPRQREILSVLRPKGKEMQTTQKTAREQFVEDYLLVTDNDYTAYTNHKRIAREAGGNVPTMSDRVREMFEDSIAGVVAQQRAKGGEYASLLIAQLLQGWGSDVFDDIARHYIDEDLTERLTESFSSSLKTGQK
jgi:hypothetical protein